MHIRNALITAMLLLLQSTLLSAAAEKSDCAAEKSGCVLVDPVGGEGRLLDEGDMRFATIEYFAPDSGPELPSSLLPHFFEALAPHEREIKNVTKDEATMILRHNFHSLATLVVEHLFEDPPAVEALISSLRMDPAAVSEFVPKLCITTPESDSPERPYHFVLSPSRRTNFGFTADPAAGHFVQVSVAVLPLNEVPFVAKRQSEDPEIRFHREYPLNVICRAFFAPASREPFLLQVRTETFTNVTRIYRSPDGQEVRRVPLD